MLLAECLLGKLPDSDQGHVDVGLTGALRVVGFGAASMVAVYYSPVGFIADLASCSPLLVLDF